MKPLEVFKTKNPVWLAASHLTENIESIKKSCEQEAGAIVLKGTDGRNSSACNRNCRRCQLTGSFQGRKIFKEQSTIYSFTPNSLLCEFLSLEEIKSLLDFLKENYPDILRIANISAKNPQVFIGTAKLLEQYGAQALELNMKYTLRYSEPDIADAERYILRFFEEITKKINLPFILKVCPNHGLLTESFLKESSQYVDGFTITNSLSRDLPPHFREKLPQEIKKKTCSVVGEPLWSLVQKYVPIAKKYASFVSASGGICNIQRAKEIMDLGADSIQLCSGIELHGYDFINRVIKNLSF